MLRQTQVLHHQEPNRMPDEIITLIDANNRVIGEVARSKMRFGQDYHRATYILIFDEQDQLIVQERTLSKSFCPGCIGITTGGVVASGESYMESAHRELQEELGFDAELEEHGEFYTEGDSFRIWGRVYSCQYIPEKHGPMTLQPDEVSAIYHLSIDDILNNTQNHQFTPDSLDALTYYLSSHPVRD